MAETEHVTLYSVTQKLLRIFFVCSFDKDSPNCNRVLLMIVYLISNVHFSHGIAHFERVKIMDGFLHNIESSQNVPVDRYHTRIRRGQPGTVQCSSLITTYRHCNQTLFWNLNVLKDKTSTYPCQNQSLPEGKTCLENFYCKPHSTSKTTDSCLDVYSKIAGQQCPHVEGDEALRKKKQFLEVLCQKDVTTATKSSCLSRIVDVFHTIQGMVDTGSQKPCNISEFRAGGCKHCKQVFEKLNESPTKCCFGGLIKLYPSKTTDTYELSPEAWKSCEEHNEACDVKTEKPKVTTLQQQQTTAKMPITPDETHPSSEPSNSVSSRLIAGAVLATVIFLVLSGVIGRYMYQRALRRKQLRYEDYGYTQLQMMEDNLYDDDEDEDDQLLSAT